MCKEIIKHVPIMVDEILDSLVVDKNGIYIDGTVGFGGHSNRILEVLENDGKVIGIDRDIEAYNWTKNRLNKYGCAYLGVHGNYRKIEGHLRDLGIELVDGILVDLGVSSYQLDTAQRGFSYNYDARLDMRMNQMDKLSAYDVINEYTHKELMIIFRNYGEEKFAKSIANRIMAKREIAPIKTTFELVDIIKTGIPARARRVGGHPAKRVFQAIRIEVNAELDNLSETIEKMICLLKPNGRLCVISFHSLEDRIIKHTMRKLEDPCTCPDDIPMCICKNVSMGRAYPRKGILPSSMEIEKNPRARSARLRVFIKA